MLSSPSRFSLYILLSFFTVQAHSSCYLPNGTSPANDKWVAPCSSDSASPLSSTCCHTKWTNPPGSDLKYGPTQDECMPSGLCQNRGSSSISGQEQAPWTRYYRVRCIYKDFKGCLDVCSTGLNGDVDIQLTPCDGTATSEKWCCGDTTACCAPGLEYKAVFIPRNLSSASNGLAPIKETKKMSSSAKTSIGIGATAGAVILLVVGFLAGHMMTKMKKSRVGTSMENVHGKDEVYAYKVDTEVAEVMGSDGSHEMYVRRSRAEMDGHGKGQISELS